MGIAWYERDPHVDTKARRYHAFLGTLYEGTQYRRSLLDTILVIGEQRVSKLVPAGILSHLSHLSVVGSRGLVHIQTSWRIKLYPAIQS